MKRKKRFDKNYTKLSSEAMSEPRERRAGILASLRAKPQCKVSLVSERTFNLAGV